LLHAFIHLTHVLLFCLNIISAASAGSLKGVALARTTLAHFAANRAFYDALPCSAADEMQAEAAAAVAAVTAAADANPDAA
jgi:hypothetical protein